MSSLLLVVFVSQLIIYGVSKVGTATLNNALWELYNRLPTSTAQASRDRRRLGEDYARLRMEMNATSSQDEFAKWAKLRRQHDKVQAELEKISASLSSSKSLFDRAVGVAIWMSTNGFRFLLQFWLSREPMFWLLHGWLPYYIEWIIACPKAPLGSISIQVWWIACAGVIQLVADLVGPAYARLVTGGGDDNSVKQRPEMAGMKEKKEL